MDFIILLEIINITIISLAVLIIFTYIFINFSEEQENSKTKKEKKSIVETGTMTLFFILFYLALKFNIGKINYNKLYVRIPILIIGWIIISLGVYFNVKGRLKLGKNWANQVKIYKNQTLVKEGVYSIVRHPLYASLIWMFYATSIMYFNWVAFLLNTIIFIPFMYYRAKQEEELLSKEFKEYRKYKMEVGMFFPKLK
jgi:protein-S-isoprenylcysteine O-methyltransferase Ste14